MPLLRQIHLAQERLEAGVALKILQKRFALDAVQIGVLLSVGGPVMNFVCAEPVG
jgi:hypothetical protein